MGCFNVPCGLSGLSISNGQEIVGFIVSKEGHNQGRNSIFEPTSIPVVGKYDDYGGLVQENGESIKGGTQLAVFCHKELWDYVVADGEKHIDEWIFENPISMKEFFSLVKSRYEEQVSAFVGAVNTLNDCKEKTTIKRFLDDRVKMVTMAMSMTGTDGLHTYLFRGLSDFGALTNLIAQRIVDDKMPTDQECKFLEELAHVYMHSYVTGRSVTPTMFCYITQDADYKRIHNWFNRISKLAKSYKRK